MKTKIQYIASFLLICLLAGSCQAIVNGHEYVFEEASKESIFRELATELRCPKCQNQNLADSNAMIADDLRGELYEQVKAGKSSDEIVDFMVNRYGEFVLYRPKVNSMTYVLWYGPAVLCFIAFGIMAFVVWGRRNTNQNKTVTKSRLSDPTEQDEFNAEEQARLKELLSENDNLHNRGNK